MEVADFDWEDIMMSLERQECILFIGPRLFQNGEGQLLEQMLYEEIDARNVENKYIRAFYEEDGFLLFEKENYRIRVVKKIRRFFDQNHLFPADVLGKLAQIPFPIIFSLTPDQLLCKAFDEKNLDYHFDFYFKNRPCKPFIEPREDRPLIYNLLGDLSEYDSLILTHSDLFDYLHSVFLGKSMHPELRQKLAQAETYIFLGLPFEKWYLQLLLRVLYFLSDKFRNIDQYASNPDPRTKKKIFEEQFNIEFVPNEGIDFINELYRRCKIAGTLKEITNNTSPKKQKLKSLQEARRLFSENKIRQGINELKLVLDHLGNECNELKDEIILQQSRFENIQQKINLGTLIDNDRAELNNVIHGLITLITRTANCIES